MHQRSLQALQAGYVRVVKVLLGQDVAGGMVATGVLVVTRQRARCKHF